ncbi:hypothetical protein BUE80_DR013616 [Diplocarpon rosae]|nr:hypothetical protein BUE80_DR013616 [Diplocarpon rosae]
MARSNIRFKNQKGSKLDDKANKGILIGFESPNNFLIYILKNRAIKSSKNVTIRADLKHDTPNKESIYINLIKGVEDILHNSSNDFPIRRAVNQILENQVIKNHIIKNQIIKNHIISNYILRIKQNLELEVKLKIILIHLQKLL